jgi:hypothetical protein
MHICEVNKEENLVMGKRGVRGIESPFPELHMFLGQKLLRSYVIE